MAEAEVPALAEARSLVSGLRAMVRQRRRADLYGWSETAGASLLQSLAVGLLEGSPDGGSANAVRALINRPAIRAFLLHYISKNKSLRQLLCIIVTFSNRLSE